MSEEEKKTLDESNQTQTGKETSGTSEMTESQPQENPSHSGTEVETKTSTKKEQSSEENAKYAEMRRKYEALERENEALKSKQRGNVSDDTLKALGLSREELDEDSSMDLVSSYLDGLAKKVDNPVQYAYQNQYKKNIENVKKAKADKQKEEEERRAEEDSIKQDSLAFKRMYPETSINDVVKSDSEFMKSRYVQEYIKNFGEKSLLGNVTKHYAIYLATKGTNSVTSNVAKSANPYMGGAPNGTKGEITEKDILKMSDSEYQAWRREQLHKR